MAADRVAFLGLGIMGWPQAANLRAAGHELTVWTRDADKAERFAQEHGAVAAGSPAEAAAEAGVAITMLPDAPEVEAVLEQAEPPEGSLVVDMSTIRPTASRAIAERLAERGVTFIDAPVTGSRPKAEDGTLTIMVGGEESDLDRARPLLEAMGQLVVHAGPHGHGSMVKLINNTLAAVNAAALAEGITLAKAAGVDLDAMEQVVGVGLGQLGHARPQGRAHARRGLRPAVQARAHAQGRAALHLRGTRAGPRPDRRRRGREAVRGRR